ncbi:hypothetical protein [Mesorhizobium sp. LNHC229A00]|nr:hypothetical protein [Mesorhizobium sp. LNHC229A00]
MSTQRMVTSTRSPGAAGKVPLTKDWISSIRRSEPSPQMTWSLPASSM